MMDLDALLDNWRRYKVPPAARWCFHLAAPHDQPFVFRGLRQGHPSNYAAVRFRCRPADALSLDFTAEWPATVSPAERRGLEAAIACGVADAFLGARLQPLWVCALTLVEIGWADIMSSEAAFYRATKGAMGELIAHGAWQLPGTANAC